MAEPKTPPWAKRLEKKLDQLIESKGIPVDKCYHHEKYGAEAKRKCDPPCQFALNLQSIMEKPEPLLPMGPLSLSPVVSSILQYMRPVKFISPIKDKVPDGRFQYPDKPSRKRKIEEEIEKI